MSASLTITVLFPDGTKREFRVPDGETEFGRAWDNDLVLNDPYVSRHNGKLIMADGQLQVVARPSANPIVLDGQAVSATTPHPIEAGSFLVVGRLKLTIRETGPGSEVMDQVGRAFEKADLPCPPVPEHLVPQLTVRGDWFFSTRDYPQLHGAQPALLAELEQNPYVDDYIIFGRNRSGDSLDYTLVEAKLAVFLEVGWGGEHMDRQQGSNAFRAAVKVLDELLVAADEAFADRSPADRMTIRASDRRNDSWWCSDSGATSCAVPELSVADTLAQALGWLRSK